MIGIYEIPVTSRILYGLLFGAACMLGLIWLMLPEDAPQLPWLRLSAVIIAIYPLLTLLMIRLFLNTKLPWKGLTEPGESEERLRVTLNSIGDAVISTDTQGMVVLMNPVAEALTGWRQADARGQHLDQIFRILNEDTRKPVESPANRVLREGAVVGLSNHTLLLAKDGTERPITDSGAPILDDQKQITGVVLVFRDQTAERIVEKALQNSEHLLRESQKVAGLGSYVLDISSGRWTSSEVLDDLFGINDTYERTVEGWAALIHPDDRDMMVRHFSDDVLGRRQPFDKEYRLIRKRDQSMRWVYGRGKLELDVHGHPLKMIGTILDITERKQAEEALRETQAVLQAAMDQSQAGIAIASAPDGILTYVNKAGLLIRSKLFSNGIDGIGIKDYMTGLMDLDGRPLAPDEVPLFRAIHYGDTSSPEFIIRSDDDDRIVLANAAPIRNNAGMVMAAIVVFMDITERRRAQVALEKYQLMLRNILDTIPQSVFWKDKNSVYLGCNQVFAKTIGLASPDEIIGKTDFDMPWPRALSEAYRTDDLVVVSNLTPKLHIIEPLHQANGSQRWVDTSKAPLLDANGEVNGIVGVYEDITERKLAEERQIALEDQLRQAQKMDSVGRLAGGVAHDFNNMLMVIMNNVELCQRLLSADHPAIDYLEEIDRSARRSADLTRQLLTFARKESIRPVALDLNDNLAEMLKLLRRTIGEDINLVWKPGVGTGQVMLDPSQADQLLANLCVNARDAIGGNGTVTIETGRASIGGDYCETHPDTALGEYVLLAVSDDGCGMSKDVLDHLFEPFYTTKSTGEGTGLGLATVYGIVKQNKGFIQVSSKPGQGSTFSIYLPRVMKEKTSLTAPKTLPVPLGHGETVLLVEDDKTLRMTCGRFLQSLGYDALVADSPANALALADQHPGGIHLLLTDVIMPDMNGRQLAVRLLSHRPSLKCLFMSGYPSDVISLRGVQDSASSFIKKPFTRDILARKLHEVLKDS